MSEITNVEVKAKPYTLRNLTADDVFPMFQIINKIGFKEFKNCFNSPDVQSVITNATSGKGGNEGLVSVGVAVGIDIAGVIIANVERCKPDLYSLLAGLSGMAVADIGKLPMVTFFEMIVDVIRKDEFRDFFGVVSKLLKSGT